jgi:ABC-2 type transport system permease protein
MNMVLAVIYREYLIRTTSMTWLFYDMFLPLTYLLLFGSGLSGAFREGVEVHRLTVSYGDFFLAGVLSMACFGIAINTSYGFFVDRDNGIFYEFLTYPMTRAEFLIGKIVFNCILSCLQGIVTIGAGWLLLDIHVQWKMLPAVFLALVIGTAGWFFFLTIFALRIRRNDMFNALLNVLYFVLMFASSLFYPLDRLPAWMVSAAYANPLTWHTEVLRFFTIGAAAVDAVIVQSAAFTVFLAISFVVAVRSLRIAVAK